MSKRAVITQGYRGNGASQPDVCSAIPYYVASVRVLLLPKTYKLPLYMSPGGMPEGQAMPQQPALAWEPAFIQPPVLCPCFVWLRLFMVCTCPAAGEGHQASLHSNQPRHTGTNNSIRSTPWRQTQMPS
jgi:hypothetical protein